MPKPIEIERKSWNSKRSAKALYASLKAASLQHQWITSHDAASASGIPVHLVRDALPMLAGELGGDLRARDDGELEFYFEDLGRRPFRWVLPPRVQWSLNRVHSLLVQSMKLGIGFLASSVAGVTLLALGFTLIGVGGAVLDALGTVVLVASVVFCLPLAMIPVLVMMVDLVIKAAAVSALEVIGALILVTPLALVFVLGFAVMANFYNSMFARIAPWIETLGNFGERAKGELADEERFAQLVRANKGRVTLGDLMILFGWERDEAFKQATRLMVDYDGDIAVTDAGTIVFRFSQLSQTKGTRQTPAPIWDDEKSPHDHLGTSGRRAGVYALAWWSAFVAASAFLGTTLDGSAMFDKLVETLPAWGPTAITVALGLCGAVPLIVMFRSIAIRLRTRRYQRRVQKLRDLREIVTHGGRLVGPKGDLSNATVAAFDGTVDVDAAIDGDVVFDFPELAEAASRWV
ncbi:MAG: hypothetical protein R3E66_04655 [bacterium]